VVEHSITQTDPDGSKFMGATVTDYYGGSLIVSERSDGSKLVVDFATREITEIRSDRGSYTVLSFDRYADLVQRIQRANNGGSGQDDSESCKPEGIQKAAVEEPSFVIRDAEVGEGVDRAVADPKTLSLLERPGVRHLRVSLDGTKSAGSPSGTVDVWFDPQIRLAPAALDALTHFETEVIGGTTKKVSVPASSFLAAAREYANGAFPIRTLRPARMRAGKPLGTIEDVTTRIGPLDALPTDLATVPEGYERTAHPLEIMASFAEEEEELRAKMSKQ
jgi:hypothetical protein